MTAPAPGDREALSRVIRDAIDSEDPQYGFPADAAADAILARWRLVPVEQTGVTSAAFRGYLNASADMDDEF